MVARATNAARLDVIAGSPTAPACTASIRATVFALPVLANTCDRAGLTERPATGKERGFEMNDWVAIKTTKGDAWAMQEIVKDALVLGVTRNYASLLMDLQVAHSVCPLNLNGLLEASKADFLHDICGIVHNLNRDTGELENCFVPRYAQRQA